ncbi:MULTISPECIES: GNAT family N-acetyltransferase [unclassified Cytobacillus]|uniref:GNAT family N-acetyltransferase n=1 Tax=unclassified Cytobacillus TaxID=2675268 RepID=UPI00135AECA5|nr:GNAT family N-acetyltransferase [Cytobacillus sp. AMY 15.2]KAF0819988.1 Acetyltransferase, GNAT family [Bacillus sp. ZZV12-4809]MCM3093161.1 GNAT family N-acetyltransferase [Cytobacillus sp. AMY 15.2]
MEKITFQDIYKPGHTVLENALFIHNHNPDMLLQYDSNFISFKRMPSVQEFEEAHQYLRDFHQKYGQKHVRFYFPDDEELSEELLAYFQKDEDYTIGFLELFAILPGDFPEVHVKEEIIVENVTDETWNDYLEFQYEHDSVYGETFAEKKKAQHLRNYRDKSIQQFIAFYKGKAAGSVDVIIKERTAEIDGLMVHEEFQKKGIGSRLQKSVMDQFKDRTIILVADGDDTPKEMYRRQNYLYLGKQYNLLKVYE